MKIFTHEKVWIEDKFTFFGDGETIINVGDIVELFTEKNYQHISYGSAKITVVNNKENTYIAERIA